MNTSFKTAADYGLVQCEVCQYLNAQPSAPNTTQWQCVRCGATLPLTKHLSRRIEITWALLIAAIVLLIPANFLPVMSLYMLGKGSPSTIAEGALQLWQHGQWPIALIIFVASLVIPLVKIVAISFLLISIHYRSHWHSKERMQLYKVIDYIGRWSMVDVFVVAILVGIVQFGNIAYVEANMGSLSFTAVVVLTMLAARTLDERQIWEFERG
ncbi:MAG: paraquat-inducible protein A [Thiofilum sp.]|uniref:paraquat-inducible protein A n=1 Tax=Thiofilum sp. TaxID=2212733 RepID=UPI0025F5CDAC|nr:paraquat-inducible protein A [Thiofilum sp.]MBK8454126.1 paraquat-inducible protein A [Thiofilum sp.]